MGGAQPLVVRRAVGGSEVREGASARRGRSRTTEASRAWTFSVGLNEAGFVGVARRASGLSSSISAGRFSDRSPKYDDATLGRPDLFARRGGANDTAVRASAMETSSSREGASSPDAKRAAEQIAQLEDDAKACLDRLEALEKMVTRERRAQETRELAAAQGRAARTGSASSNAATDAYGKPGGVHEIDARIASARAVQMARDASEAAAKLRHAELKRSLGKMDEHVAAMEALTARAKDDE